MTQEQSFYYKDCLTNESLLRQSPESQFDIVNRAIKVAEYTVRSGRSEEYAGDNVAYQVLAKMADHGLHAFDADVE